MKELRQKAARLNTCGQLMILTGVLVFIPVCLFVFYPQDLKDWPAFVWPALFSIVSGVLVCLLIPSTPSVEHRVWSLRRSSQIVLFAWVWAVCIGAAPFVISGQLKPLQAVFESVSGWTTAGLSVMDVTRVDHAFLFYRSFMQFCGGLGFVFVVLLLVHDRQSMNLYSAEGHPDRLAFTLKQTTEKIFILYVAMLAAAVVIYRLLGMPVFDGINHAMCALSTGGFSIKLNSIGEYQSLPVELFTIVLMLAGTTNFAALFLLLKGKIKRFFEISEVRLLLWLLIILVPAMAWILHEQMGLTFMSGLREALFNGISALSTAGFSLSSFDVWPPAALNILILMMLIGGGLGSTAGGMKLSRVYILLKTMAASLYGKTVSGRRISQLSITRADGKAEITDNMLKDTAAFVVLYLLVFAAGSTLLAAFAQCSLSDALFEFASSLGTVGLSIGVTSASMPAPAMIVEIIGMLAGRLEIVIIFVGLYSFGKSLKRSV